MMTVGEKGENFKFCIAILGQINLVLEDQIAELNLPYSTIHKIPFIDADSREEWHQWKLQSYDVIGRIGIGAGSAGCAIGHLQAWKTLEECQHDYLIVLEDDAQITEYGKKHLAHVMNHLSLMRLNLVHLGDHIAFDFKSLASYLFRLQIREFIRLFVERKVFIFFKPKFVMNQFPFSGHAYIIHRELARIAISKYSMFLYPIDVFLNSISQVPRNLVARIRTPLIIQSNLRESHIKARGR